MLPLITRHAFSKKRTKVQQFSDMTKYFGNFFHFYSFLVNFTLQFYSFLYQNDHQKQYIYIVYILYEKSKKFPLSLKNLVRDKCVISWS